MAEQLTEKSYNELQTLASEEGHEDIIGASKDELIEFLEEQEENNTEEENQPDPGRDGASKDEGSSSSTSNNTEGEKKIELTKHLEEEDSGDEGSDAEEEVEDALDEVDRKGLDKAVNEAWGSVFTLDMEPDSEDRDNLKTNLSQLAEDVGLGENVKWYADEHLFTDEEQTPRQALITSLILASILSLGMRPDLAKKGLEKAKQGGDE